MPWVLPAGIRDSFTMVRLLEAERMNSSRSSARAASWAIRAWKSASLFKMASMVHWIRSRLSLRFWMAAADISRDVLRATMYITVPKTQKTSKIERSRGPPLRCSLLSGFSFIFTLSIPPPWGTLGRLRKGARGAARGLGLPDCMIIPFPFF